MKKRKISAMFTLVVIASLVLLGLFPQAIQADTGPKPSITIEVTNAPKDYYVALLGRKGSDKGNGNSELKLNEVTRESVEAYLESFQYDEWYYYKSPLGDNLFRCNEGGEYRFWYMVPNPFRVILIDMEGNVHLSNSVHQIEYNAECTYDVEAGTLKEHIFSFFRKDGLTIFGSYVVTLIVELIILIFFFPLYPRNLFWFWLANTITNIPFNLFIMKAALSGPGLLLAWLIGEALVIVIEGLIYAKTMKEKTGKRKNLTAFTYSMCANIVSALCGILIQWIYTTFI